MYWSETQQRNDVMGMTLLYVGQSKEIIWINIENVVANITISQWKKKKKNK